MTPLRTLLALVFFFRPALQAQEDIPSPPEPLATIAAVSSLSDALAGRRLRIEVTGVVTAVEKDWRGQFFVQDETGGVWVEYYGDNAPAMGSVIRISGQSHPGAFAPIIAAPQWTVVGQAQLPAARDVDIEDLVLGVYDGQRVAVEGVVRSVEPYNGRLRMDLAIGGHRLEVHVPLDAVPDPAELVAATVIARGTTATHYNPDLRHLTGVGVYVVRPEDFQIARSEPIDPFQSEIIPIRRVAQHRKGMGSDRRIRIQGVITHTGIRPQIFVQDRTGALRITSQHAETVQAGQFVEVVGFLEFENHLPVLNDAVFKPAPDPAPQISAQPVPVAELKRGLRHGEFISLAGKVVDRTSRPILDTDGSRIGSSTTWLVQGDELSFTIEHEALEHAPVGGLAPIGSSIQASGVCFSVIQEPIELKSLRLLISHPSQIAVLKRPSWLTPARLLFGLGVLASLLLIAVVWSLTVAKKNAALKVLVAEKQNAQDLLREANETLEHKVIERSKQLHTEMTARKAAQLEFKAVISERTRLARDLHDTLEQALTGISLQLDTATKLFSDPAKAEHHVRLARRWLQQSQLELRQSIWDLRSRELEQFDLAQALRQSVERLAESAELQAHFQTTGERQRLPETVEENVLRIGYEALTNIAKHSGASNVWVQLSFAPGQLDLEVRDDGCGFDPAATPETPEHHYGLLGMRERAQRIQGSLTIESRPGEGTVIRVAIPFEPRPGQGPFDTQSPLSP